MGGLGVRKLPCGQASGGSRYGHRERGGPAGRLRHGSREHRGGGIGSRRPQAGTRAQAEALAGHLIARLVLPPGTEPARLSPLPATLRDPWGGPAGPAASGAVDRGRVDAASLTPADAEAFMLTHAPRGAGDAGTGQEKGSRGIIERYLYFQLGSLPKGIDSAEVQVLMVPRGAASTLIATYVHVAWFPSRTAAEHLDTARFGAVSIRAIVTNPKPRDVTRTFRSPADIAMLAGLLNGFAAAPKAARTCLSSSASFQITFQTRTAQQAGVTVFTYGCNSATITVGGVPQPAPPGSPQRAGDDRGSAAGPRRHRPIATRSGRRVLTGRPG